MLNMYVNMYTNPDMPTYTVGNMYYSVIVFICYANMY